MNNLTLNKINKSSKTKWELVYHGTNVNFSEFDISKIGNQTDEGLWGRGFYFSPNKEVAKLAPRGNGTKYIKEVFVDKNKLFDIAKYNNIQKLADDLDIWEGNFIEGIDGIIRPNYSQVRQFTMHVKQLGFNGVYVDRGGKGDELVIFDPANIKTKEQITDNIYKKAPNKVLETIELDKKLFKYMYPFKVAPGVDNFCYHIDTKKKIINQFSSDNVKDYLNDMLPEGKILYIDYFEIKSRERDRGIGSKVIQDVIKTSKELGLSGIYLDSYEESTDFWDRNGFNVDSDSQEDLNGEKSNYHCTYFDLTK